MMQVDVTTPFGEEGLRGGLKHCQSMFACFPWCDTLSKLFIANCILESFLSGAPRFSHLTLTGGAIGSGPPLALGAAVACPDKQVINIQADGSAMYGLQVCIVWCNNTTEQCNRTAVRSVTG
eukprot:1147884-Pelagomonas_calceolata.AAC.6